ncbi:glycosyltransferase [Paenibacillus alba]|uniref:Glycosyltransferase n=1 Tax=Paenibacillus alba TaxID=1197127 RepID=A0ABU6FXQ9_9BACL|nr:glycosyltransferase [Paenibacillus alba]MEC0226698.1 glycosyltransferase [Paenibacillus alba]
MHTELSVVIPVYNSQDSIKFVVESLLEQYATSYEMEIILVNDGSIDQSHEICSILASHHLNVTLLDLKKNYGQQAAILQGLRVAQGDYIALMDDDMQNPPEELIKLMNKIDEGFEVVIGQRVKYNQTIFRRLISYLNNLLVNWLLHSKKRIYFSNFIVMKKPIATEILKNLTPNPNILGLMLQITNNIANTPTEHRIRKDGKSNYTLLKLLKYWFNMLPFVTTRRIRVLVYSALLFILFLVITCICLLILFEN